MTTGTTTEDWRSAWPDALAFAAGLALAWRAKWTAGDLVWSLWLASLVVGYTMILWTILRPAIAIMRAGGSSRRPVLRPSPNAIVMPAAAGILLLVVGGLFMLAFFTVHFGMFHYVHSQFLATFFPINTGPGVERGFVGVATYVEVGRRYWWFLPAAFLAERGAFVKQSSAPEEERPVTMEALMEKAAAKKKSGGAMFAPYRNVVRMHLLIFFFAFAHFARLDNFAVYAVVYAVYFFPWRLVRREAATRPVLEAS